MRHNFVFLIVVGIGLVISWMLDKSLTWLDK